MAIIRGKAGRYTSEEAARLRHRFLIHALVMMALVGFCEGVTLSNLWQKFHPPGWLTTTVQYGGLCGMILMAWWGLRKLDRLEAERINWQKGDEGETAVGKILATLSDDFYVINDISTPSGNLDHVVVGPTGVFVLDAKNWRGLVQPDGKGELLLNGEPPKDCSIRKFVARCLAVKDKVCLLAPGTKPYLQGVFVFTSAWVAAPWGQTGRVNCLHDRKLKEYIEENKGEPIAAEDVKKIADAFWKVAQLDPDFTDEASEVMDHISEESTMQRRVGPELV